MKIESVFSHSFEKYGKVLTGYDVTDLLKKLDETTKKPADAVILFNAFEVTNSFSSIRSKRPSTPSFFPAPPRGAHILLSILIYNS